MQIAGLPRQSASSQSCQILPSCAGIGRLLNCPSRRGVPWSQRLMVRSRVRGLLCWMYLFPNWLTPRGQPVWERLGGTTDMAEAGRLTRPPAFPGQGAVPHAALLSHPPKLLRTFSRSRRDDWTSQPLEPPLDVTCSCGACRES
ncbi:hypothetical protein E2320_001061 [Naja naja]|nr:hypothetical protein E2320_001061 [Naja naja]